MTKLLTPTNGAVCPIMTETQKQFFKGHDTESRDKIDWRAIENSGSPDRTLPLPVILTWETDSDVSDLHVSLDGQPILSVTTSDTAYALENLMSNQTYEWSVNGVSSSFTTEDTYPRWLHADGLSNIRDLGAWPTEDGRRIRQGLLYRGTEMDTHHTITDAGRQVMNEVLKIRTDLDLRGEAVGKVFSSPMGDSVDFQLIPIPAYDELTKCANESGAMKQIFELLADESSYPIYFHCWGGADRTGCLAFMLEALLGVSFENRLLDYELTSLSVWGIRSRNGGGMQDMLASLREYGDDPTYTAQSIAYLKDCGITDETLDAVKRILLDD